MARMTHRDSAIWRVWRVWRVWSISPDHYGSEGWGFESPRARLVSDRNSSSDGVSVCDHLTPQSGLSAVCKQRVAKICKQRNSDSSIRWSERGQAVHPLALVWEPATSRDQVDHLAHPTRRSTTDATRLRGMRASQAQAPRPSFRPCADPRRSMNDDLRETLHKRNHVSASVAVEPGELKQLGGLRDHRTSL